MKTEHFITHDNSAKTLHGQLEEKITWHLKVLREQNISQTLDNAPKTLHCEPKEKKHLFKHNQSPFESNLKE